jgi:hypothetical protein
VKVLEHHSNGLEAESITSAISRRQGRKNGGSKEGRKEIRNYNVNGRKKERQTGRRSEWKRKHVIRSVITKTDMFCVFQ